MILKKYSLAVLLAIVALTLPLAQAAGPTTTIITKLKSTDLIDIEWRDRDRMVRVWTLVLNFDVSDEYFVMNIVNPDGTIVRQENIEVYSTTESGIVHFGSIVTYIVDPLDVCADELEENANYCPKVLVGEYEMQVVTKDGTVVESQQFSVIDNRGVIRL